ncbi:hypothetical protein PIROE2DRAFT_61874 [Piromyces sp. E2]|nr:hypothetical protein PIROE2DRAFT_61874 [Piromyces sp. E2]|eukprot:OUM62466.1 hypothetical protein PIROE2DRAFT_61874 [Piromyces sp. E2]
MDDNFLNKELLFNKKRKLEKGKEKESYPDLLTKNHIHKSSPSLLSRKRLSDSDFNFNVSTSDALHQSLDSNWVFPEKDKNTNLSPQRNNLNFLPTEGIKEIEDTKIIVNEPPDIPIVEEFDEQNDPYSFFNSKTLQYEFTTEGIKDYNTSNTYSNNNYDIIPANSNNNNSRNEFHRQESSLIPFKQEAQVILFNNNNTGQVVLYNKANKSLSVHKVRPLSKELLISDETGHYYDDYSSNSDLWSLGVVLYYICFSEMPYSQVDDIDILKNEILNLTTVQFKNDNNSNRVPKELKSLIKKLMVKVPTQRPKAREILNLYGGYKDGSGIKISTNVDNISKSSSNPSSASSSTKNLSESPIITKNKIDPLSIDKENLNKNNNYDSNYLSPLQNTNIPKNKMKGKEKETEKENENENENKQENISNKIETKETFNKNESINSKDKEKEKEKEKEEWLDKEIVDEPLSFQAEKRIVPFNHNRSKSLPQIPNNQIKYVTYKNKLNNTVSLIEEEKTSSNEQETYKSEKSLVPFHEFEYPERSLPSQSYPPIKHNDKEHHSSRDNHLIKKQVLNKDKWMDEREYTKEIIKKKSRDILNNPKEKKKFIGNLFILIHIHIHII